MVSLKVSSDFPDGAVPGLSGLSDRVDMLPGRQCTYYGARGILAFPSRGGTCRVKYGCCRFIMSSFLRGRANGIKTIMRCASSLSSRGRLPRGSAGVNGLFKLSRRLSFSTLKTRRCYFFRGDRSFTVDLSGKRLGITLHGSPGRLCKPCNACSVCLHGNGICAGIAFSIGL